VLLTFAASGATLALNSANTSTSAGDGGGVFHCADTSGCKLGVPTSRADARPGTFRISCSPERIISNKHREICDQAANSA
jgi:hypothetical protein